MNRKVRLFIIIFIYLISFITVLFLVKTYSKTKDDYLQPIKVLSFGDERYTSYIKSGFGDAEGDFRRSIGKSSILFVPLSPEKSYDLTLNLKSNLLEEREQVMEVIVNSQLIGEITISNINEYKVYNLKIPSEYIKNSNYIVFETSLSDNPTGDKAELAVDFNYIKFLEIN